MIFYKKIARTRIRTYAHGADRKKKCILSAIFTNLYAIFLDCAKKMCYNIFPKTTSLSPMAEKGVLYELFTFS